jgi:ABC-2 type transport system permease protein
MNRALALLGKDLADLRQNPGIFVPALLVAASGILMPFFVAIIVPYVAGERLADSSDFQVALEMYREQPATRNLDPEGAIQAWLFQQFLVMLMLAPTAASMAVAAYSVIGEKQARTLEPLLATPITTFELLLAKVLAALVPTLLLSVGCYALYVAGIAMFARPGVYAALLTGRSLAVMFLLGPLAALAALQLAVCVSSRVNDPRSAQQLGALVILPMAGLFVAQISGAFLLTAPVIALIAVLLAAVNAGLMRIAITLFDRESILTRWK